MKKWDITKAFLSLEVQRGLQIRDIEWDITKAFLSLEVQHGFQIRAIGYRDSRYQELGS
jgi:hypothetical protein